MYGHWIGPSAVDGVDHVHTCTRCLDDVACPHSYLDCPRYLGIVTGPYECADENALQAVCPLDLGQLLAAAENAAVLS